MKKIVTLLFSVLVFVLLFFAIIKVIKNITHANENKETKGSQSLSSATKIVSKKIRWKKNQINIPYEFWNAWTNEPELKGEQKYFLIEQSDNDEFCELGIFTLESKTRDQLIFEAEQAFKDSKLEKFSKKMKAKLSISALGETNFLNLQRRKGGLKKCNEWLQFSVVEKIKDDNLENRKGVQIQVGKKRCFSSKRILSLSFEKNSFIELQDDKMSHKICFYGLREGAFLLDIAYEEGDEKIKFYVTQNRNFKRKIPLKSLRERSSFDKEVKIPYSIPGWK